MIPAESDLLLFPQWSKEAMQILKQQGKRVDTSRSPVTEATWTACWPSPRPPGPSRSF